jgi:hypothetical protein
MVALVACAGCGGDDDSGSGGTGAPPPTDSGTPTEESADRAVLTLTQADDGCTLTGPTEVPAGEIYYFVVENPTDLSVTQYVSLLADGHTFQEFVDLQPAPGEFFPKPSYIVYASSETEATREFNDTAELAEDEVGFAYSSEPGPHAVYTWTSEDGFWICGSFDAT